MDTTFYIGATALHFRMPFCSNFAAFDEQFHVPCLPVEYEVYITVQVVKELPVPPEGCLGSDGVLTWEFDGATFRYYTYSDYGKPYFVSRRSGNEVVIYALEDVVYNPLFQFRPWFHIQLESILLENNALILHSASLIYQDEAILFSAPSGTGKTTQTNLWHKFRKGVSDINGDRTLLQRTTHGWYACGFPLYGSSVRCVQTAAPIGLIAVVRQSGRDEVLPLNEMEKFKFMYSECTVPSYEFSSVDRALRLLEELIHEVPIVRLNCTMEESAVDALEQYGKGL